MLETCTSEAAVRFADSSTIALVGSLVSTGDSRSRKPSAGSSRIARTSSRMVRIRSAGSGSASGPAIRMPAKRLPPSGSPSRRTLTGMATGIASTITPYSSWWRRSPPSRPAPYASLTEPPPAYSVGHLTGQVPQLLRDLVVEQALGGEDRAYDRGRGVRGGAGYGGRTVGQGHQLYQAQPVGEAVVDPEQVRRLPFRQPRDQHALPRRPGQVQRPRQLRLTELGDRDAGFQLGQAYVIGHVEVGHAGPGGLHQRHGRFDHPFPQPRDPLDRTAVRRQQSRPLRRPVEDLEQDPRRAGTRVHLGAPHQRFPGAHLLRTA